MIARSPSASFFGGSVGLYLHHLLLGELFEITPAEFAHELEGRGRDGAAIGWMGLDDLAHPARRAQESLRASRR
jgi:hypothetical protein